MKKNILVFPCGSEIGLEIYRSLSFSTHFKLYGGSSVNDHGKFVYKNYIGDLPTVHEPDFIEKINGIVDEQSIDYIIPAHDSVVLKLAQEREAGRLKADVVTSSAATCETLRSKLKTYSRFNGIVPTPKVYDREDLAESDLPLFLKPDVGQGSKDVYLAKTSEDIEFYTKKNPSLIILEYLPGKEYTVECLTNKEGKLLFYEGRERVRIQNGISVNTVTVEDKRFKSIADKINQTVGLRGGWFFQVKENTERDLVLLEIAPRIAGTMALVRAKGVNLTLLSLFDRMGYDIDVFENTYKIVVDRALENTYQHDIKYGHVYLDFDDLVVLEGKVNPNVMAFVYQCLNNHIKVHLLTRHKEDLSHSLNKHRLNNIFDDLIWIKNENGKYEYIKEKDAIFIDDSFAERKKVHDKLGIPVFDAHMLESLMEKF